MPGGRYRGVLYLVLSLAGAILVTALIYRVIYDAQKNTVEKQRPQTRSDVVVAASDIPPGWTIKPEHLATRQLPEPYVPDEVYRSAEEIVGRVAMERILAGEFIREERLADAEGGQGFVALIPRGMRAMQVPINNAAAVSGFINPGNFTDIIAVCTAAKPPEVRTLLQSVSVLAVNDRMTDATYVKGKGGKGRVSPTVTVALTPPDAELVKHAFASCRITLTLRNDIDVTNIDSNDGNADGSDAVAPGPSAPPAPPPSLDHATP
ncbi:MAG: Flp pilus assembly protein CpaB [Alphaproteobacteria bacterium]|nr:Flp pilus assembly protein CpaB [Alphaproteobacteria bacterium]